MEKKQSHQELIYNYPLYSLKRFPRFIRYCKPTAKAIANKIGGRKSWLSILADMIWCDIRYGAMDSRDYLLFEFWKKSAFERNTFFTKRRYYRLLKSFDKETFLRLGDKAFLYKKYADFIHRDWMLADSETDQHLIREFFARHDRVLVKPLTSEQGKGIHVAHSNSLHEIDQIIEGCKLSPVLLEEVCVNCKELDRINSSSLNTLRVYTIVTKDGDVQIPSVSLRCGCGNTVVDNWGSGGVGYPVDIESGIIYAPGVDKKGNTHIYHPGTDIVMPGFRIPRFKEACEMAKQVIRLDTKVAYAGHDIAILPDRLEMIELNFPGGHDFLQAVDLVGKNELMQNIKVN